MTDAVRGELDPISPPQGSLRSYSLSPSVRPRWSGQLTSELPAGIKELELTPNHSSEGQD